MYSVCIYAVYVCICRILCNVHMNMYTYKMQSYTHTSLLYTPQKLSKNIYLTDVQRQYMVEMIALKAQRILVLNEEYYKWRLTKDLTPRPLYDEIKETTQAFEGRYIYRTCVCILMLIRIVIAQCGIAYYRIMYIHMS